MKSLFTIVLVLISATTFAQKFMIVSGDTLPYKEKPVVQTDTVHFDGKTYYPGDTLYEAFCHTFERSNGQIINQTDDRCLQQGLWIITDSVGNYSTGAYHNGHETGLWKKYDKNGKLLKEMESISIGKETYELKEIDYSSGHPVTIIDKPFLSFFLKNLLLIGATLFALFAIRLFINSEIYNVENGTQYSPIYFFAPGYIAPNFEHSCLCTFTLWFFNYKPVNRKLVIISNTLSAIAVGIFLGIIIGLTVTGELF